MALLTELLLYLGIGIFASAIGPILAAVLLPPRYADRLADIAWQLTMNSLGRALFLFKETTMRPVIVRYGQDSYLSSLTLNIGGERKHYFDFLGAIGTFHGRPLGIVIEDLPVVVNPRLSAIASQLETIHASDSGVVEETKTVTRNGQEIQTTESYINGYVPLLDDTRGVPVGAARRIVSGDATAELVELVKTYTENSQTQFDSLRGTVDYFIWLTALGVGFGLMWLASRTADTGVSVPTDPFPAIVGVMPA